MTLPLSGHTPESLMLLLLALGLDAALGEMRWLFRWIPHPVVVMGNAIGWLDRRLNRAGRSPTNLRLRGVGVAIGVPVGAAVLGGVISFVARTLPHAWILEVFITATLIAQRSLFQHVHDVARALKDNGLEAGRYAVSRIVGRDTQSLNDHAVARAAIESLAENFSDAVVAPVFWYVVAGLPGILAYKAVNTLDSMIGHRNDKYRSFGWASARLDDLLNLLPARLSGLMVTLAAPFTPSGRPVRALVTMLADARHHRSPNSGWPEAAMAGALSLSLGGPRRYPGLVIDEKWMGKGRISATITDINRALILFIAACVIDAGGVAGLLWVVA